MPLSSFYRPESELKALIPAAGVTVISISDAYSPAHEIKGPAFPTPEREAMVARVKKSRRLICEVFIRLPKDAKNVFCDNAAHVLGSRIPPEGDRVDFYNTENTGDAVKGPMPADFVYLTLPWPPTKDTKRTDRTANFVCGFCAAMLNEGWREAEAEGLMS